MSVFNATSDQSDDFQDNTSTSEDTELERHFVKLRRHGAVLNACQDVPAHDRKALLSRDATRTFLETIYGGQRLQGAIPLISVVDGALPGVRDQHQWHTTVESAVQSAIRHAEHFATEEQHDRTAHIAATTVTFGERTYSIDKRRRGIRSAGKDNVLADYAVKADADKTPFESYRKLAALGIPPTIEVASGGTVGDEPKLHLYWKLNRPATGSDLKRTAKLAERIAAYANGDPALKWIGHNLRVPGGVHRKGAPRPTSIVALRPDAVYSLEELEAALDRVAPEPKSEGRRKSAREKSSLRHELIYKIRNGEDLHDSCVRFAMSAAMRGDAAEEIQADLEEAFEECRGNIDDARWNARFSDIARIVDEAVSKAEDSETFVFEQLLRERLATLRDPAKRAEHREHVDRRIDELRPESVTAGPDALNDLIDDVALLLPDNLAIKDIAERICAKIGGKKWVRDLTTRIKRATGRARGLLKRGNTPAGSPEDARPLIDMGETGIDEAVAATWAAVKEYNAKEPLWPQIFRTAGGLGRIVCGHDGRSVIQTLEPDTLSNELRRCTRWRAKGSEVDTPPAFAVVGDMLAEKAIPVTLPVLTGVVDAPRFGPDGSLITEPGYHANIQKLYQPAAGFQMTPIPDKPSTADVQWACDLILNDLCEGFTFRDISDPARHEKDTDALPTSERRKLYGQASRANTVAVGLLPFCEPMIKGATPLFVVTKPKNREGATLLIQALGIVWRGHAPGMLTQPKDNEEWQKTIATKIEEGADECIIDNVTGYFASSALASAITNDGQYEARALHTNRLIKGRPPRLWLLNGKNVSLSSELSDRAIQVRISSGVARPELRSDFQHTDLLAWVREHRADLVRAFLILIQNWIARGSPRDTTLRLGGFDDCVQTLGGILKCAGIDGFMKNRVDLDKGGTNRERDGMTQFLTIWDQKFGDSPVSIGHPDGDTGSAAHPGEGGLLALIAMNEIALTDDQGTELDLSKSPRSAQTQLGNWLRSHLNGPVEIVRHGRDADGEYEQTVSVAIGLVLEKGTHRPRWCLTVTQEGPRVRAE